MKTIAKSWLSPESSSRKFLASLLAYNLSRIIPRKEYEVLTESYIDINNMESDLADVIIYNSRKEHSPDLVVEFCSENEFKSKATSLEILTELYHIKEAFIYNFTSAEWYRISDGERIRNTNSHLFNINLGNILHEGMKRYLPSDVK
jgi:hypothetical protein